MANIKDFIKRTKSLRKSIKTRLDKCIRETAIQGVDNIKSELTKEKQEADVSYKISNEGIKFLTEPKTEQIKAENLSGKEVAKFKKVLGDIPLEMLSEEINKQEFSEEPINRAMKRTQETLGKKLNEITENLL